MLIRCLIRCLPLQDSSDRFVYYGQYHWVSVPASEQEILRAKQDANPDLVIERLLGLALLPETLQCGPYVADPLFGASMLFRCQALSFGNKVLRGELWQGDSSVRKPHPAMRLSPFIIHSPVA